MKKLFIGLAALFVLLSFSGCTKDLPPSTSELAVVFYTDTNPNGGTPLESLPQYTTLQAGQFYYLMCVYHQPDLNIAKMRLEYNGKYKDYIINDDEEWGGMFWENEYWTLPSGTEDVACKFYLIDNEGRRSNSVLLNLTIVAN
ncbi:MAG: hypothetical protein J6X54_04900 [Treponema sp.]|nr:hypothetical protein [Treponema sp.]